MNGDVPSNSRSSASELGALFREDAPADGADYVDESGHARPTRGDDEAPWGKTPPFATAPQAWVKDLAVPLANAFDYVATPAIDCLQQRLLQIYFDFEIIAGGDEIGQLSFIAEGSAVGAWYVVGVVDLTVTLFTPVSVRFPYGNLGSRTFSPAELRAAQLAGPGHVRWILAYDVSPFESFRLNVRDLVGSGSNLLSLHYTFSQ